MSKTVVITGANRGIGLGLAQSFVARGDRVIGLVRQSSGELDEIATQIIEGIEITQADGLQRAAAALADVRIDLLLNVAGLMRWETFDTIDPAVIREQFEINSLAPLLLTHALRSQLGEGSKVAFLTSRLGSLTDNTSGKGYGYRMSKAALNMAARSLAIDLEPQGIAVGLLHPGSVQTSLNKLGGQIPVSEAVAGLIARIDDLTIETTGRYVHQNGTDLPW